MDHYPFKSWILDEIELDQEQRQQLEEHLAGCPQCAQLSQALTIALQTIRSASEQAAPPDFTRKWTATLEARRREQEKKQARTLTIVLGSTALIIALVSLYIFAPEMSLISLAAGFISTIVGVLNGLQHAVGLIVGTFEKLSPSTVIISALILAGWTILAVFTLGLSIWKLAFRKSEVNK